MSAIHPILVMLSLTPYFTLVAGVEELDVVYSITRSSLAVSLAPGEGGDDYYFRVYSFSLSCDVA